MNALRVLATVLALGWVLALTGCQGEQDPGAQPRQSAGSSDPGSPTATPSPSETVEPADGQRLRVRSATVRLPDGWIVNQQGRTFSDAVDRGMTGGVLLNDLQITAGADLDSMAERSRRTEGGPGARPERLPNRTVDGVEGYVVAGPIGPDDYLWEYGTLHNDARVSIQFRFLGAGSRMAEQDVLDVVEPVLATWQWK